MSEMILSKISDESDLCTMLTTLFLVFIFCVKSQWLILSTENRGLRKENSHPMLSMVNGGRKYENVSLAEVIQLTTSSFWSPLTVEGIYNAKFMALISSLKLNKAIEFGGLFWELDKLPG